jgi:hypothetical protein
MIYDQDGDLVNAVLQPGKPQGVVGAARTIETRGFVILTSGSAGCDAAHTGPAGESSHCAIARELSECANYATIRAWGDLWAPSR